MDAIRIRTRLEPAIFDLPELKPLVGKIVEIRAVAAPEQGKGSGDGSDAEARRVRLRGSVLRNDDPFGPAVPLEEWEALQ